MQTNQPARLRRLLRMGDLYTHKGKIRSTVNMTVEVTGLISNVGDICTIYLDDGQQVLAEVIGIRSDVTVLMPYQDVEGIGYGNVVINTNQKLTVPMSDELIGRTIDALGRPIDGGPDILPEEYRDIDGLPMNPAAGRRH